VPLELKAQPALFLMAFQDLLEQLALRDNKELLLVEPVFRETPAFKDPPVLQGQLVLKDQQDRLVQE
jgi:hypothetical protein